MIGKLTGTVDFIRGGAIVINVGGVGYRVFVNSYTLGKASGMEAVELFIHTHVREDAILLYGFLSQQELEMFEMLISVSGVGPKAGMGILSIADPTAIRTAILNNNPAILTRVSGVGKKTAERVILELKGKVAELPIAEKERVSADSEAVEALMALGYSGSEARDAMKHISSEVTDVGERVRLALKSLGKK